MQNNSSGRKVGLPWSNGSGINRKKGLPSKTKNHTHRQSTKKDYPEVGLMLLCVCDVFVVLYLYVCMIDVDSSVCIIQLYVNYLIL